MIIKSSLFSEWPIYLSTWPFFLSKETRRTRAFPLPQMTIEAIECSGTHPSFSFLETFFCWTILWRRRWWWWRDCRAIRVGRFRLGDIRFSLINRLRIWVDFLSVLMQLYACERYAYISTSIHTHVAMQMWRKRKRRDYLIVIIDMLVSSTIEKTEV